MLVDPVALCQFEHKAAFQAARGRQIQAFQGGGLRKGCQLNGSLDALVMTACTFQVHQERQTFFERELSVFRVGELLLQAIVESWQAELDEFVEQGLGKHGYPH